MEANDQARLAFDRLAARIFRTVTRFNPTEASWLGLHGANDKKLANRSAAVCEEELAAYGELKADLEKVPADRLDVARRIDHRLALGALTAQIAQQEKFPSWKLMPQNYVDEMVFGVYLPMIRTYAAVDTRARDILGRLKAAPRLYRQAAENITRPPRIFTETAILSARGAVDFLDTAVVEFIASVPRRDLRSRLESEKDRARRATERFTTYLEGPVLRRSSGRFAVGKPLFNKLLRHLHGIPFDADELLAIGRRVYDETLKEIKTVAGDIDGTKGWDRIVDDLKRKHPTSAGLIKTYVREMNRARSFVKRKNLASFPPGESIEVVPTPGFARPVIPYAAYLSPAPFEEAQKGTFWATLPDPGFPEAHKEAMLQGHMTDGIAVTSLHEAYPGHHLQLAHANRVGRPLRHLFTTSVMAEGWALYCEEMMYEQGFYKSPASRLLQLKDLLWRACRVTIDVGLHTGKMTFEDAVELLVSKAKLERPNAEAEVRRYCATPTQPMSYVVGKILIHELLRDYKAAAGSSFRLKAFHDDFLSHGTVPVELIRMEMGIARTEGNGPEPVAKKTANGAAKKTGAVRKPSRRK